MYHLLLWLALHIKAGINVSYQCIPGIVAHDWCYISHWVIFFFLLANFLNCVSCITCILQTCNKTSQFFIQIKFISFPVFFFFQNDSAHLLSHYYYYFNYCFYYYLLLIFFYMFCFAITSHFYCLVMPRYL